MQRLRQRKFNQALVIGKAYFPDYWSRIRVDILIRHRATAPQTALNGEKTSQAHFLSLITIW
jgi:predicted amidophosphoribosyltransferase